MSDIDSIPACPATAGPARGADTTQTLRLQLIVDGDDFSSPALQALASIEASASPAMITRSQSSEMQAGFFSLSLARTPSSSGRSGEVWDHPPPS